MQQHENQPEDGEDQGIDDEADAKGGGDINALEGGVHVQSLPVQKAVRDIVREIVDDATFRYLNDLNRRFYETVAIDFDATRQQAWAGWERLLPYLHAPLSILDIGCGNGRFGAFLAERIGKDRLRYVGRSGQPP